MGNSSLFLWCRLRQRRNKNKSVGRHERTIASRGRRRKINPRAINVSLRYRFDVRRNGTGWDRPFATGDCPRQRRAPRTRRASRRTARRPGGTARGSRDAVIAYLHRETRVSSPRTTDGSGGDPIGAARGVDGRRRARIARAAYSRGTSRAPRRPRVHAARPFARGIRKPRDFGSGAWESRVARHRRSRINGRTSASSSAFRLLPWRPPAEGYTGRTPGAGRRGKGGRGGGREADRRDPYSDPRRSAMIPDHGKKNGSARAALPRGSVMQRRDLI